MRNCSIRGSADLLLDGVGRLAKGGLQGAAEAVSPAPWVLQDFPQANGVHMSTRVIATLAADERCVMLKAEDWPGLDKISTLKAMMAKGARLEGIPGAQERIRLPGQVRRQVQPQVGLLPQPQPAPAPKRSAVIGAAPQYNPQGLMAHVHQLEVSEPTRPRAKTRARLCSAAGAPCI